MNPYRAHLLHNYLQAGRPSGTINTRHGSTPTQSPKRQHGKSRPSPPILPAEGHHQVLRRATTTTPRANIHMRRMDPSQVTTPTAQQVPRSKATKLWRGGCSSKSRRRALRALGVHRMATTAVVAHHHSSPEWAAQARTANRASCHLVKRSEASCPRLRRSLAAEALDHPNNSTTVEVDTLNKATASNQ